MFRISTRVRYGLRAMIDRALHHGQGPVWLLMHGWSGSASQFYPLMSHIAAQGYTALAYDHPAHGRSEGNRGHLPRFVRAFDEILERVGPVQGVITHSMGGAVTLSSRHPAMDALPLLLISPVLDYVPQLYGMVARSGYSIRLFDAVVKEIEHEYQHPLSTVDPLGRLARRSGAALIVHDEEDRFAPHRDSLRAAQDGRTRLVSTRGLGHGRNRQRRFRFARHGADPASGPATASGENRCPERRDEPPASG